tara:strand:- start:452 stop:592 length:141 start_codon:yes stop_codon:yes gene_type:complete
MANPDYYDLRKLRSLVEKPKGKPKANPNTAVFNKTLNKPPKKKKKA